MDAVQEDNGAWVLIHRQKCKITYFIGGVCGRHDSTDESSRILVVDIDGLCLQHYKCWEKVEKPLQYAGIQTVGTTVRATPGDGHLTEPIIVERSCLSCYERAKSVDKDKNNAIIEAPPPPFNCSLTGFPSPDNTFRRHEQHEAT